MSEKKDSLWKSVESEENVVKALRSVTGLSQAKFAEKYDIPKRTIENWEAGVSQAPYYLLKLLARAVDEDFS